MEPSPPILPAPPDPARGRARPDPNFALEPFPAPRLPFGVSPVEHQRLVVNPFLAVLGLIGWAWGMKRLLASDLPPLALVPLPLLGGVPWLVQYHCADCGATGTYPRAAGHACPKILARAHRKRTGWFRWPSARTQLVVWCYLLASLAVLGSIVGVGVRFARW